MVNDEIYRFCWNQSTFLTILFVKQLEKNEYGRQNHYVGCDLVSLLTNIGI